MVASLLAASVYRWLSRASVGGCQASGRKLVANVVVGIKYMFQVGWQVVSVVFRVVSCQ